MIEEITMTIAKHMTKVKGLGRSLNLMGLILPLQLKKLVWVSPSKIEIILGNLIRSHIIKKEDTLTSNIKIVMSEEMIEISQENISLTNTEIETIHPSPHPIN